MKWKIFRKIPIKYRIAIIIALAQGILLAIVLNIVSEHFNKNYRQQQRSNEVELSSALANIARTALMTNNIAPIQSVMDTLSKHAHIEQIVLLNKTNQVIAQSLGSTYSTQPTFINGQFTNWTVLPLLNITSANSDNLSGLIAIQYSSIEFAQIQHKTTKFLIIVTGLSIIFITAIAFLIGNSLSIRIDVLRTAASGIASGHKIEKIETGGDDELTELSRSFNKMVERVTVYVDNLHCNQQQLLQAQNSLEQRIINRTEQLAVARDHALDANKTKSQFLANMSHELRTPLNAIIGYSELLSETAEPDSQATYVDDLGKIRQSGTHLLGLINQILDLSKVEAGKAELFIEKIGIKQIVYEAMINIKPIMDKNNNTIQLNLTNDIDNIHSDRTKLIQILINLLQNAAKFTQNGTINFSVTSYDKNNETWLNFSIQDSGIGIDESKFNKLFSEFSQADESTTSQYGGSGLGLAICKNFSVLMGGDVSVKSKVGLGSTFTLSLPQTLTTPHSKNTPVTVVQKSA